MTKKLIARTNLQENFIRYKPKIQIILTNFRYLVKIVIQSKCEQLDLYASKGKEIHTGIVGIDN